MQGEIATVGAQAEQGSQRPRDKHYSTILRAAQEEFAVHGFKGARMQAIADRAGLPKANVHYYFKNKNSLYLAVLDNILNSWNDFFNDVSVKDDPALSLDTFIRQKVRISFEDPSASKLFANEIIQGAPYLSGYLQDVMKPWVTERAEIIQGWIDAGKMPETDPVLLIFMIWATTQHYADFQVQVQSILETPDYDEEQINRIADFVSSTILKGCGLQPPVRAFPKEPTPLKTWIKDPTAVWTGNDQTAPRGIVVEDNRIIELVSEDPKTDVDEIFDATDQVLLPGLINCHHHFYQTLTRAFPDALDKELFEWLVSLYPIWANLDEDAIRASTTTALSELLLSGCTTTTDHHYVFSESTGQAIDVQADVAKQLGIRAILTRGSMSLGKSSGGLPPDKVVQSPDEILRDSERLISAYHDDSEDAMLQIALAPCSPFSVTTELMKDSAELARKHGVQLHTHLAETLDENEFCLEMFGMRPVDYLEDVGWLADDVWLAHGIHFNDDEIQRLGKAGVAVSHCPSSNMILASGSCPVPALGAAGSPIGLGVDGSASNDCSNMMQELRQAFLLQRLAHGASAFSHHDALRVATQGGAQLFKRSGIGELAAGKLADVALFDLNDLRFSGAGDPIAGLVLCGAHQASAVMVNGQWRVRNSALVDVDLERVRADHISAAHKLWNV